MVEKYLCFFAERRVKATFFVVGKAAKENPTILKEVISEGHEIACHGYDHTPLDHMDRLSFIFDLRMNKDILMELGAEKPVGFRAPFASLIPSTNWAWDVLLDLGFKYSSSVLPARNPYYGWEGHPLRAVRLITGLVELPVSVTPKPRIGNFKVPFVCGTYLRTLPTPIVIGAAKWYAERGWPIVGYVHPYDVDAKQGKFKVEDNPFFNWLYYYNRRSTFKKLDALIERFPTKRCKDYVDTLTDMP
jgi:polysaccharide deacetylase family protein (PEP-CTERM system associated)